MELNPAYFSTPILLDFEVADAQVPAVRSRSEIRRKKPSKSFQKKRRTQQYDDSAKVRQQHDPEAVKKANLQIVRQEGHNDRAFIIKALEQDVDGELAKELKKVILGKDKKVHDEKVR